MTADASINFDTILARSISAAERVFDIFELAERILLIGTFQDTYIQQRVCKTWHTTIANSKPLQRKMFRLASGNLLRALNRTPLARGRFFFTSLDILSGVDQPPKFSRILESFPKVYFNANQQIEFPRLEPLRDSSKRNFSRNHRQHQRTGCVEVSWGSMLITQPPVTAAEVTVRRKAVMTICNPRGITIEDVWHCERMVLAQKWPVIRLNSTDSESEAREIFSRPDLNDIEFGFSFGDRNPVV